MCIRDRYLRLAFAIAAHLEPEVLLLDEVLAVGDKPFQEKCLEKMKSVSRDGRTVFFVSHNLKHIEVLQIVTDKENCAAVPADRLHFLQTLFLERLVADCQHFVQQKDFRFKVGGNRECKAQVPVSYTHLTLPTSDLV